MTEPDEPKVIVVGAGPAGVAAALWLDDFDVPFDWVDARGRAGGMLHRVHNDITDYPGRDFENGSALAEALREHVRRAGLSVRDAEITRLTVSEGSIEALEHGEQPRNYRLAILATGTRYRRLGVPGEAEGMGQWVSQSATADAPKFAGRPVAVVGGGDAGFENALTLADHDCGVTMLLRSPEFRARSSFVEAVREHPAVEIAPIPSVVERIEPTDEGCRLHLRRDGRETSMEVAGLFVRIGVDPVVPDGCDELETDDEGYLVVDSAGFTSDDRVLAAGDVTSSPLPSVATAVGEGATTAHSCASRLGWL